MHIAICDDNVADRKQLERLLSREADAHIKGNLEPLYIDSFGNIASLMRAPKIYDVFFIDMSLDPDEDGLYVSNLLRTDLITAPIVLCSGKIDYQSKNSPLSDLIYLNKELTQADIANTITTVWEMIQQAEPTYEIRGVEKTIYIHADDFIYAEPVNDRQTTVYLSNGYIAQLPDTMENLACLLESHPSVVYLRKGYLFNSTYLDKVSPANLTLQNGKVLPLAWGEAKHIKKNL